MIWTIIGIMVFIILLVAFWKIWLTLIVAIIGIPLAIIGYMIEGANDEEEHPLRSIFYRLMLFVVGFGAFAGFVYILDQVF